MEILTSPAPMAPRAHGVPRESERLAHCRLAMSYSRLFARLLETSLGSKMRVPRNGPYGMTNEVKYSSQLDR